MTGYLTQRGEADGNLYQLVIPNREVRNIMTDRVMSLFKENVGKDGEMVNSFCNALLAGDTDKVEELKSVGSPGQVPAAVLRCFVIRIGCRGLCTEQNRFG